MTLKLLKLNLEGLEPLAPFESGEEIQLVDFGKIDPYLTNPHSIICLMLQVVDDAVVDDIRIYSISSSSIPEYKIWYSASSEWLVSPSYEEIIRSSSEIPWYLPDSQNLFHISGSSILSGSSYSGSSQYMHLMLEFIDPKYPFGIYEPVDLDLRIHYNDIS